MIVKKHGSSFSILFPIVVDTFPAQDPSEHMSSSTAFTLGLEFILFYEVLQIENHSINLWNLFVHYLGKNHFQICHTVIIRAAYMINHNPPYSISPLVKPPVYVNNMHNPAMSSGLTMLTFIARIPLLMIWSCIIQLRFDHWPD